MFGSLSIKIFKLRFVQVFCGDFVRLNLFQVSSSHRQNFRLDWIHKAFRMYDTYIVITTYHFLFRRAKNACLIIDAERRGNNVYTQPPIIEREGKHMAIFSPPKPIAQLYYIHAKGPQIKSITPPPPFMRREITLPTSRS